MKGQVDELFVHIGIGMIEVVSHWTHDCRGRTGALLPAKAPRSNSCVEVYDCVPIQLALVEYLGILLEFSLQADYNLIQFFFVLDCVSDEHDVLCCINLSLIPVTEVLDIRQQVQVRPPESVRAFLVFVKDKGS